MIRTKIEKAVLYIKKIQSIKEQRENMIEVEDKKIKEDEV